MNRFHASAMAQDLKQTMRLSDNWQSLRPDVREALAYRRCASEVRMLAAGGTPPPPGMRWDYPVDET